MLAAKFSFFRTYVLSKTGIMAELTKNLAVILSSYGLGTQLKKLYANVDIDMTPSDLFAFVRILMDSLLPPKCERNK